MVVIGWGWKDFLRPLVALVGACGVGWLDNLGVFSLELEESQKTFWMPKYSGNNVL